MLNLSSLKEICRRFNEKNVRYVLIGGFAVILHGFERATRDIDFLIDPSEDNVQKIKEALQDLLPEACRELQAKDVLQNAVVRLAGEDIIIDLMGKIGDIDYFKGVSFTEKLDEIGIPVADLDTMIELKRGVRDQDRKDFLFLTGKKDFLRKRKTTE